MENSSAKPPTPPLEVIKAKLPALWKLQSKVQIINLAVGFAYFRFQSKIDLTNMLTRGLWFLRGQALNLFP